MGVRKFDILGPCLIENRIFSDDRGYFYESYQFDRFKQAVGHSVNFVQDNQSFSIKKGTVRGLHYQSPPYAQAKLVRCIQGSIVDIIVDVRVGSVTFGEHIKVELTASNHLQLFVPEGFLHGFCTTENNTIVAYKVNNLYSSDCDGSVMWNSPSLGLDWGVADNKATLSEKDTIAPSFEDWTSPFKI